MKQNKKIMSKIATAALAGTVVFTQLPVTALAAESPSEKEEVVYAILDGEGKVTGVYVVNSFAGGDIVDYGDYTNVKNLTSTDEISQNGEKITFHSDAEKVYYQGDLEKNDIPWDIAIHYYMDGTEYTAKEIAGMSGKLEIHISITRNENCDESFWEGYALQASLTLDSEKCTNIVAEDATIANVGSDKQLSYIILPDKGADLTITADVTEFEMDAISINAMKLNLNFEMDSEELSDQVSELQDAIEELNDGAGELNDGAGELDDGAGELSSGAKELSDGAKKLSDGASGLNTGAGSLENGAKSLYDGTVTVNGAAGQLNNGVASMNQGISTIQEALQTLDGKSGSLTGGSAQIMTALKSIQSGLSGVSTDTQQLAALASASGEIKNGIDSLVSGLQAVDGSIDAYNSSLSANLSAAGIGDINAYIAAHQQAIAALDTLPDNGLKQQLNGLLQSDIAYIQASSALINGIDSTLDSKNGELMTGALALQQNYAAFNSGIQEMVQSLGSLNQNMAVLKNGIDQLTDSYAALDSGIDEYTEAVAQISAGYQEVYSGALELAKGTSALYGGTTEIVNGALGLYNGSTELKSGAAELSSGATELKDGASELKSGAAELKDGTSELYGGTTELKDGTDEFYERTGDLDTELSDKIDEKIEELTGKNIETVSFTSANNTNVNSVLFVIKTPAIEIEEPEEPEEEQEEEKSFGQKFLDLFR